MTTGSVIGAALLVGIIGGVSIPIETPKGDRIKIVFNEEPNGDYRVLLYGSDRSLVCEEQDIKIIQQGDAVKPLVIECRHEPYVREQ
jgi:hypothetical protein